MRSTAISALLSAVVLAGAGVAAAKPPLRDVSDIDDQVYYILVAYVISEECSVIDARKIKGVTRLWSLGRQAQALGYSEAEIKAYIRSDEEKARMRKRGEAYMKVKGVSHDEPESFCELGHAEIERNSAIGVYLRAK